jgi:hypothetical protein
VAVGVAVREVRLPSEHGGRRINRRCAAVGCPLTKMDTKAIIARTGCHHRADKLALNGCLANFKERLSTLGAI